VGSVSASKRAKQLRQVAAPGVATAWLGAAPVFAFGDGTLLIGEKAVRPHHGGMVALSLTRLGDRILTAGDDGCVMASDGNGDSHVIYSKPGAWLDVIVPHPTQDACAVIEGRDVLLLSLSGDGTVIARFKPARAPCAISLSGDGKRLAIGHSGGVSLFVTDTPDAPEYELPCAGGPISVALDPSGGFLFAGLSEPALAGWRLADGQGFRMGGYPGKPKQLVFHSDGKALLTSGGPALLVWPMVGSDGTHLVGPMGQAAGVFRPRLGLATAVAAFGHKAVIGWSDGGVDVVDLLSDHARHLGGPKPKATLDNDPRALTTAIISVAFRADGKQVSWIGEQGAYGTAAIG
jgi:hypothetical protein